MLADYEQSITASEIPAQIGDINTEDLVGPSALQCPGNWWSLCISEGSEFFEYAYRLNEKLFRNSNSLKIQDQAKVVDRESNRVDIWI